MIPASVLPTRSLSTFFYQLRVSFWKWYVVCLIKFFAPHWRKISQYDCISCFLFRFSELFLYCPLRPCGLFQTPLRLGFAMYVCFQAGFGILWMAFFKSWVMSRALLQPQIESHQVELWVFPFPSSGNFVYLNIVRQLQFPNFSFWWPAFCALAFRLNADSAVRPEKSVYKKNGKLMRLWIWA